MLGATIEADNRDDLESNNQMNGVHTSSAVSTSQHKERQATLNSIFEAILNTMAWRPADKALGIEQESIHFLHVMFKFGGGEYDFLNNGTHSPTRLVQQACTLRLSLRQGFVETPHSCCILRVDHMCQI